MPKAFKVLSADEVIKILSKQGFSLIHQKGSHIKMNYTFGNMGGTVIIPNKKEIAQGTLRAIYKQTCEIIGKELIEKDFKN